MAPFKILSSFCDENLCELFPSAAREVLPEREPFVRMPMGNGGFSLSKREETFMSG
jgi:hypothetical protein